MKSKIEGITVVDSNAVANAIMNDIIDIDRMERTFKIELSSSDLFKIDCAILSSLRSTQDFSRDLLQQLEAGMFENYLKAPQKDVLREVQQETIMDVALKNMFDEIIPMVSKELRSI